MRRLPALLAALLLPLLPVRPLHATKPCGPDTWYAKPDRTPAEWAKLAAWVAVAKVTARKKVLEPYANCTLQDRSGCTMEDRSIVTVKVLKVEKGELKGVTTLSKGYCAPDPPAKVGETYRFYGVAAGAYIYFEKAGR